MKNSLGKETGRVTRGDDDAGRTLALMGFFDEDLNPKDQEDGLPGDDLEVLIKNTMKSDGYL